MINYLLIPLTNQTFINTIELIPETLNSEFNFFQDYKKALAKAKRISRKELKEDIGIGGRSFTRIISRIYHPKTKDDYIQIETACYKLRQKIPTVIYMKNFLLMSFKIQ